MTRRLAFLPLIAGAIGLSAFGLAGCTKQAQNETAQAADTVAADANATADEAIKDTDAATDAALGAAQTRIDKAGDVIGNKLDRTADKTGAALKDVGNEIED